MHADTSTLWLGRVNIIEFSLWRGRTALHWWVNLHVPVFFVWISLHTCQCWTETTCTCDISPHSPNPTSSSVGFLPTCMSHGVITHPFRISHQPNLCITLHAQCTPLSGSEQFVIIQPRLYRSIDSKTRGFNRYIRWTGISLSMQRNFTWSKYYRYRIESYNHQSNLLSSFHVHPSFLAQTWEGPSAAPEIC